MAPSVVVSSVEPAAAAAGAGSAGSATTGGVPLPASVADGAASARTEVPGLVGRVGVVVDVRFGSTGSGGVSATTASSIRC